MKKILILQVMAFFALFLCVDSSLLAQLSTSIPISKQVTLSGQVPIQYLPGVSQVQEDAFDAASDTSGIFQFAYKFPVTYSLNNGGLSQTVEGGERVWRMGFSSPGAGSLGLDLSNFNLSKDARVYVYSPFSDTWVGPITGYYNNSENYINLPPVSGDLMIIEVNYPITDQITSVLISGVNHDYKGIFYSGDADVNPSLPCQLDVNCDISPLVRRIKRSVVKIVYDGKRLCTGTLLSNMPNTNPFVLTAGHCFKELRGDISFNDFSPSKTSFYFNVENATCRPSSRDPQTYSDYMFVNGATPLSYAFRDNFDYFLMSLNTRVPSSYDAYYAGWNATDIVSIPGTSISISHPQGDLKMIAYNNNSTNQNEVLRTFGSIQFDPGFLWEWSATRGENPESYSSGAGLFMGENIVGTISAGSGDNTCDKAEIIWYNTLAGIFSDITPNIGVPISSILTINGGASPASQNYWDHAWISAPTILDDDLRIHSSLNAIASIGSDVFFRDTEDWIYRYFWNGTNWDFKRLAGTTFPDREQLATGSLTATANGMLYYRGRGDMMNRYVPNGMGGYSFEIVGVVSSNHNISNSPACISSNVNNQIFFRGEDNFIHLYTGATHNHHILGFQDFEKCAGDVVGSPYTSQMFYRGSDGQIHTYFWTGTTWQHGWVGGQVHAAQGSIAVGPGNDIFFRDNNNFMRRMTWTGNTWLDLPVASPSNSVERIGGDIAVNSGGQVFYEGQDGRMHTYVNGVHDHVESSWQTPSLHNVSGSIVINGSGQIFYRGSDRRLHSYWWKDDNLNFVKEDANSLSEIINLDRASFYAEEMISERLHSFGLAFPNPVSNEVNLPYTLENPCKLDWRVINLMGVEMSKGSTMANNGQGNLTIPTTTLQKSSYALIIELDGVIIHRAIFIK